MKVPKGFVKGEAIFKRDGTIVFIEGDEDKEESKRGKISKLSLFFMCVLISTCFIYYSGLIMDYLNVSIKLTIIILAPI
ncbi:hypothetical protein HQ529_02900 [Candidatus Woesearchaeota archaeon]|nr:hypothetical protein [Candidatus Woesearchaeota archaeon]